MAKRKKSKFLYLDIVKLIIDEYKDKPYFTPLKSEREFCEQFDVSRPTIRKAFDELQKLNRIQKIAGKGAVYIGREDYVQSVNFNKKNKISFFNNAMMRGDYVENKVLFQNVTEADKDIALRLGIEEGEKVFHLQRLRKLNGNICSLENSYIPFEVCPSLVKTDFSVSPLHNTLRKHGIEILHANRIVEVTKADEYDAMHLGVKVGEPVTLIQSICFDKDNKIIEYVLAKNPAYRMRIEFDIKNG